MPHGDAADSDGTIWACHETAPRSNRGGLGVRVRGRPDRWRQRRVRGSAIYWGEEDRWHRDTCCVLAVSFRRSFEDVNWIFRGTAVSAGRPIRRGRSPSRPTSCAKVTRRPPVPEIGDVPSFFAHSFARDRTAPCRRRSLEFRRRLNSGRLPEKTSKPFGSLCRIRSPGDSPFAGPRAILGPMFDGLG